MASLSRAIVHANLPSIFVLRLCKSLLLSSSYEAARKCLESCEVTFMTNSKAIALLNACTAETCEGDANFVTCDQ